MDRRTFLSAGTITVLNALSAARAEQETNAAPYYRNAFLLLPELSEIEDQFLETVPAVRQNAMGLDLVKRSQAALQEMTRGAAVENCDWGADYFVNFLDAHMDSLMKGRKIARLACLRATYSFQQKQSLAAMADLAATAKMARHIGSRGPVMATLVEFAIEHSTINVAAAFLPQQDPKTLRRLVAALEIAPKSSPLREAYLGEKEFLLQHIRPQYQNKTFKEAIELLSREEFGFNKEEVAAIRTATGADIKGLLKLIDDAAWLYEDLARISVLPSAEFKPAVTAFHKQYAQQNPFAVSVAPGVEQMRYAWDRVAVRFSMLRAAVAIVSGGIGELKSFRDPFGDGPFEYRPFHGGFELKSKLQRKDTPPVMVTVGMEAKE